MVRRRQRERSVFEVLRPDGHTRWPDWLRRIDTVLEDEAVIETVAHAMEPRWPQSRQRSTRDARGGCRSDADLKHLFDWSDDDLEHEVRANLVYRAFTQIDAGDSRRRKRSCRSRGHWVRTSSTSSTAGTWTPRSVPGSRTAVAFGSTPRS